MGTLKPLKKIDQAEFAFRETLLPLFWLTNPKHKIFSRDVLIFYHQGLLHVYYLNKRDEKEAAAGYRYFKKPGKFADYLERGRILLKESGDLKKIYKTVDWPRLDEDKLAVLFDRLLNKLTMYSNFYSKCEAARFERVGNLSTKNLRKNLNAVAKLRFSLRKKVGELFYLAMGRVLEEISRRFDLKGKQDINFYTAKELAILFKEGKKLSKAVILRRKQGYSLIKSANQEALLAGVKHKELWQAMTKKFIDKKTNFLKGKAVWPGCARGRVRIILHKKSDIFKEVAKFKKGEILVTEMTRPNTVFACRKAKALITDEGGITCHAAIIARELKIPGVVGTQVATQILKDGDYVEVDADKGIIKIIKRC